MKTLISLAVFLTLSTYSLFSQNSAKEILLVGTMHNIPKIVKHNYKPMLKKAIRYNPDIIFVESPMPKDSISWNYLKNGWSQSYQKFYRLSDSLKHYYTFNGQRQDSILKKPFEKMSSENLNTLIFCFAYQRDYANYDFYSYIKKHGIKGAKKPTRHEDGDLTYKLALSLNIKRLNNMDDQQTNKEYHEAWQACAKAGSKNGDNEINQKINKRHYRKAIFPALFRNLGKHTNGRPSLERLHSLSSFGYVTQESEACQLAQRYWNERNMRMAKNIAQQVLKSNKTKHIVLVGASHIIGLEKELKANYPELTVKLYNE